jgi:hypothetical protein
MDSIVQHSSTNVPSKYELELLGVSELPELLESSEVLLFSFFGITITSKFPSFCST